LTFCLQEVSSESSALIGRENSTRKGRDDMPVRSKAC
jgi:hypothetical protein